MGVGSGVAAPSGRGELRLPGRTAGGARSRIAQSDLAAAISGRIRATGPGRASAAPPTSSTAAPAAPPTSTRSSGGGYGDDPTRSPYGPHRDADPYREAEGRYRDLGDAYRDPGFAGGAGGRGAPVQTEQPDGRPLSARVTVNPSPTPVETVETVDAEIIDASLADGAEPYERYTEPEPTARFAERDLGARLREHARSGPTPTASEPASWTRQARIEDAEIVAPEQAWAVGFVPANETESKLLAAAETNNTDSFLSTLLLARVILPVPISMPPGSRPRDKYFPWQIEEEPEGQRFIAVFTSTERLLEYRDGRFGADITSMSMRFIELIDAWPSEKIQFSINPGTPVGSTLPGSQIVALAAWATEVGLRDEPLAELTGSSRKHDSAGSMGVAGAPAVGAVQAIVMQRTVPPAQLPFYLERGYDRVSGFVNRASEVSHLHTPRSLYRALGLVYKGSPFSEEDADVHVLRWVAHRPDLYRLPYGGRDDAAMRAMQGWVIERSPFRGNGFAPGDTDVVAEFKVDSARLPHGAQMWRLSRDGDETLVARFDADAGRWVPVAP
jgi:hypothetical protein